MRKITTHKTNECNSKLEISVLDEPGAGGANHVYVIEGYDTQTNVSADTSVNSTSIVFQNGPIGEVGTNGLTQEALLAIVIDRLESFQNGPYACTENADALKSTRDALAFLQERTNNRVERGVEGTHEV